KYSGSCVRVFVLSCLTAVGWTTSANAQQNADVPVLFDQVTPAQAGRRVEPGQRVAVVPVTAGESGAPQGYSVVLVVGDMQATSTDGNVPAAARKALTDMKDFLPYKSYHLLDAQW